jgi:leader peptidase (prepilin peptidase)/N-methyltransferase
MSPELLDALQPFPTVIAGVLGLIFGSFLNVCIHRLPQHRSVVHPGSACPACGAPIRWYDNIPVLSWLVLRGRCRDCGAAISFRYAFIELFVALLFIFSVRHFGLEWPALKFAVFGWLIVGLIFTDYETRLLPDAMTLPGALLGILFSLLVPIQDVASVVLPALANLPFSGSVAQRVYSLADGLLAVILTAGFLYGTRWLYLKFRGVEGLGLGDVKLIAMIGFFLGLRLTLTTLLLASVAGAFAGLFATLVVWVRRSARRLRRHREPFFVALRNAWGSAQIMLRSYPLPFGVFLGGAALLAALFG